MPYSLIVTPVPISNPLTYFTINEQVKNENYDVTNENVTSYNAVIDHVTTIKPVYSGHSKEK